MRALTSSGLGVGIKGDRDVGVLPALRVHEKLEVNGYVVHGLMYATRQQASQRLRQQAVCRLRQQAFLPHETATTGTHVPAKLST